MTPHPIRPLAWLLRVVTSREAANAAVGDMLEELRERRAAGCGPRWASAWINLQVILAIASAVLHGVPRQVGSEVNWMIAALPRAFRNSIRQWRTTLGVLAMIALGGAASSVAFGLTTTLLTNPLGLSEPERVVAYRGAFPTLSGRAVERPETVVDYAPLLTGVSRMAIHNRHQVDVNLSAGGRVRRVRGAEVSAGFFETLGVALQQGRTFRREDMGAGRNHVVILGDALHRSLFDGTGDWSGATVRLNEVEFAVIGIAPPGLRFPGQAELWIPIAVGADRIRLMTGPIISYTVIGRLDAGVSLAQAHESWTHFAAAAERMEPGAWPTRHEVEIVSIAEEVIGPTQFVIEILSVALILVWIAAAANITALVATRAERQRPEFWTRRALGASPGRIMRDFAAEGFLLVAAVFLCGIGAGAIGLRVSAGALPEGYSGTTDLLPSGATVVLYAGVALVTGILAVVPGLRVALRDHGEVATTRRPAARLRQMGIRFPTLIQVAAAMVLLTATSVLATSLYRLGQVDLGFDPKDVVVASVVVPWSDAGADRAAVVYGQAIERIAALPGISSAGATSDLPLSGADSMGLLFAVVGEPDARPFRERFAFDTAVTGDYFDALGTPLLAGRSFGEGDGPDSMPVAIVSATLANRYGGPEEMLGKEITLPGRDEPLTVVGVVGDVRNLGPLREVLPQVFRPSRQHGRTLTTLVVRSDVPDATSSLPAVREVLHDVAPDIPVYDAMALSAVVRESTALQRRAFAVVGIFSLIATILAGTGVFAALNHFVAIRRREMGIRAALGAGGIRLARLIFARASALTILGGTLGTFMTFVVLRFVSASQFGVLAPAAWDYAAAIVIILGVAAVACLPAALQAARVNPVALLRTER